MVSGARNLHLIGDRQLDSGYKIRTLFPCEACHVRLSTSPNLPGLLFAVMRLPIPSQGASAPPSQAFDCEMSAQSVLRALSETTIGQDHAWRQR